MLRFVSFSHFFSVFVNVLKWLFISVLIGVIVGTVSSGFLLSLHWAETTRETHRFIIWFLPLAGFFVGCLYHYFGKEAVAGNNLIIQKAQNPDEKRLPFIMAPLVYVGTIATHLFGGSAGREGTAVQMGASIADQFSQIFKLGKNGRYFLITMGVSAGFAGVFGTPLAGAIFALEVLLIGRLRYDALVAVFLTAVIADVTNDFWGVPHTHYIVNATANVNFQNIFWAVFVGVICGLVSRVFVRVSDFWNFCAVKIKYAPLRPFLGGLVIAIVVFLMGTTKYIGLGIDTILASFSNPMPAYDFIIKLLLTTFTLSFGFKGGEVTPLFFIGATLGSALFIFVPLPFPLLSAMGFVAVFAGATNTPLACMIMGIELFGEKYAIFIAVACVSAYFYSGHRGIYTAQKIGSKKILPFQKKHKN